MGLKNSAGGTGFPACADRLAEAAVTQRPECNDSLLTAHCLLLIAYCLLSPHPTFLKASAMLTRPARQAGSMAARRPTVRATASPRIRVAQVRGKTRK